MTPGNSWEYQKRNSRLLLQSDTGISSESVNRLRKKSSDLSVPSEHHRCNSLINLNAINNNQFKHRGRFSIFDLNYKKSSNLQITSTKHQRRHSERGTIHRNNPSITINHYITYKYETAKPKSVFTYNPITYSTSTTASNLTHSTVNTTTSESSNFIDQNKLLKPITTNFHRK